MTSNTPVQSSPAASSSQRSALVLVPGAFSPTVTLQKTARRLRELGHDTYVIPLQTVGRRPAPTPHLQDDAVFVAREVRKLVEAGKQVVLLGHSYGGAVISESLEGLSLQERRDQGKQGGVVRLVYLAALVPSLGQKIADSLGWEDQSDSQDPYFVYDQAYSATNLNDIEDEKARHAAGEFFTEMSAVHHADVLTWPGYRYAPSTYIRTKRDLVIPPERQQIHITELRNNAPKESEVQVVDLDAGHCPNLSMPLELADVIDRVLQGVTQG